jgi:hypothetical protein
MKAIEQGVARLKLTEKEEYAQASAMIKQARDLTQSMMDNGFIKKSE